MTTSVGEVVASLGQAISQRIGEPRYKFWFAGNTKFAWEDGLLTVGVPNHFFQEWMQKTFADAVRAAASEVLGCAMQIRFTIDPELFRAARQAQLEGRQLPAGPSAVQKESRRPGPAGPRHSGGDAACGGVFGTDRGTASGQAARRPRRWRRLSDFVVGSGNRLAHASATSVVEAAGECANPLVLYGPVGTGKTHLLEGIYCGLRRVHPEWRVCFVSAEEFTNRFVQGMRLGKLGAFRKHFRECEALLVDDLHFLASKRATQEEFLHTFDALQADGRQLVVSCDCHPKLADEFSPLLADRLLGGAVWGLTPPDLETRLSILRCKSARNQPAVPEPVLRYMAEQLHGNVRELEGALHSVRHYAQVSGRPVDLAVAREALGDLVRHAIRVVQLLDIDRAVCRALGLESGTLQTKRLAWAVSHPRMLAMYLARKHTAAAYSEIGRHFGGRNHSTAVAAEKKVRQWLERDEPIALGDRRLRAREFVELVERDLLR